MQTGQEALIPESLGIQNLWEYRELENTVLSLVPAAGGVGGMVNGVPVNASCHLAGSSAVGI